MVQPQQQRPTRGQIFDRGRSIVRPRTYPAKTTKWTLTVAAAETGDFVFFVDSVEIKYTATVPPDDDTAVAAGLVAKFLASTEAMRVAYATSSGAVVTIEERIPGYGFEITGASAPGAATLTPIDVTNPTGDLALGIAVAPIDDDWNSIRELNNTDTAQAVLGVTCHDEGSDIKLNDGDPKAEDVYEEGSAVDVHCGGLIPVQVEAAFTNVNLPVFVRKNAPGTEQVGAFSAVTLGGDGFQLTGWRWATTSYLDKQGRLTADLLVPHL
jgi:hypothetical protein